MRKLHTTHALAILRERAASPVGLTVCFGAGVLTGRRKGRRRGDDERRHGGDDDDGGGFFQRLADGPAGGIAARLAAALLVRALMDGPETAGGAVAEPIDAVPVEP